MLGQHWTFKNPDLIDRYPTASRGKMAQEIERKYLVKSADWPSMAAGIFYKQGYIATQNKIAVRVRIVGNRAFLTLKSENVGPSRLEFEYEIPVVDANSLIDKFCEKPLIEKTRYKIDYAGLTWEVDVFSGDNEGLTLAEVELESETQKIECPPWIAQEVTGDAKYYNSNLAKHPYNQWAEKQSSSEGLKR